MVQEGLVFPEAVTSLEVLVPLDNHQFFHQSHQQVAVVAEVMVIVDQALRQIIKSDLVFLAAQVVVAVVGKDQAAAVQVVQELQINQRQLDLRMSHQEVQELQVKETTVLQS